MTTPRREDLMTALPYARRFARALTGSQPRGDALVAACLRESLANPDTAWGGITDARHALYGAIVHHYAPAADETSQAEGLSATQRELLLLTALEDVTPQDAALILGIDPQETQKLLADARARLRESAATEVMIIEDELIIAMDLEELVHNCGHRVVGVARTEAEAVALARRTKPGLILADINLGAGGDGTNAVAAILRSHYAPVIFVTAYPERLLTGDAIEPAFVITKPFEPLTLAIATYQAVTGGVQLNSV